ncbi:hypothetical protein [Micromonospora sp. NPDC005806]|uniref:hypothetical protein n=1 Tax=Micromonospora sp. NPDC005806 TaxID=3364234 RepID=UPI00369B4C1E
MIADNPHKLVERDGTTVRWWIHQRRRQDPGWRPSTPEYPRTQFLRYFCVVPA